MMTGLYHPDEFRDNCGFGLIAHMKGDASHKLLQTAIESLTCMTHRGGIAADGKTGDGCGLLIQSPDAFLKKAAKSAFGKEPGDVFAVGQVFLNPDEAKAAAGRAALEAFREHHEQIDAVLLDLTLRALELGARNAVAVSGLLRPEELAGPPGRH